MESVGKDDLSQISRHRIRRTECPEFTKTMVRVKKHVRPPVRADPEKGRHSNTLKPVTDNQQTTHFQNRRKIYGFLYYCRFNDVNLSGGPWRGVGVWGVINLMEGYGSDNPASKSQGVKQLMAGGGIMLLGLKVVPMLSTLITI